MRARKDLLDSSSETFGVLCPMGCQDNLVTLSDSHDFTDEFCQQCGVMVRVHHIYEAADKTPARDVVLLWGTKPP